MAPQEEAPAVPFEETPFGILQSMLTLPSLDGAAAGTSKKDGEPVAGGGGGGRGKGGAMAAAGVGAKGKAKAPNTSAATSGMQPSGADEGPSPSGGLSKDFVSCFNRSVAEILADPSVKVRTS